MALDDILLDAEEKMIKSTEVIATEFAGIRTGKASPDLVTNLMVEAYGTHMRLKELAAVTTPDPRLILIQPWDAGTVDAVRKALEESKLGISPQVDGKLIRLPIPPLSEERRQDLVKATRKLAEEGRVSIRACRRHAMDEVEENPESRRDHRGPARRRRKGSPETDRPVRRSDRKSPRRQRGRVDEGFRSARTAVFLQDPLDPSRRRRMTDYPPPQFTELVAALRPAPQRRTRARAERHALFLLNAPAAVSDRLAAALTAARARKSIPAASAASTRRARNRSAPSAPIRSATRNSGAWSSSTAT